MQKGHLHCSSCTVSEVLHTGVVWYVEAGAVVECGVFVVIKPSLTGLSIQEEWLVLVTSPPRWHGSVLW